jgi:polyisoprenoid-binding protein YceI
MKSLSAVLLGLGLAASAQGASFTADPAASTLGFTGVQAGAEFKGVFKKFDASVDFAADALAASRIDVQIDLGSVDSKDGDRDKTIKGPDIFDVAHNPSAHYLTKSITKTGSGYAATGALTLHGVTKDVPITFTMDGSKLAGSAQLKRLEFGVGQGDWKSTEWIGDVVKINFTLVLKPKP